MSANALQFAPTPEDAAKAIAHQNELIRRWEAAGGDAAAALETSDSTTGVAAPPPVAPKKPSALAYAIETIGEAVMVPGVIAACIAYAAVCWAIVRWAVGVFKGGPLW